jgi:hypothetical protein
MKNLNLGKYRQARIWIGELPDAESTAIETLTHSAAATAQLQGGLILAAVEVFVPLGPRSMYGLLGGEWRPDQSNQFRVEINVSAVNERLFPDNLALKGDEVRVGLPAEYAKAIPVGVALVKDQLTSLPSGKLSINRAAYGAIGSCEAVYKHLAAVLVKLVSSTNADWSDEELVKLFPITFS